MSTQEFLACINNERSRQHGAPRVRKPSREWLTSAKRLIIGERLTARRVERQLSTVEVARLCRRNLTTILSIERGGSVLCRTIQHVEKKLGTRDDPHWLLGGITEEEASAVQTGKARKV